MKILLHLGLATCSVWVFSAIGWIQYGTLSGLGVILAPLVFSLMVSLMIQVVSLLLVGMMWASKELAYAMAILLPLIGAWATAWCFEYLFGSPITIQSWWMGFIMAIVMIFLSVIKK